MKKPVSEHSTTIKARRGEAPPAIAPGHGALEPVGGGMVRRVEFDGDQRPVFQEASVERSWHARAHDSIDQIHFEVDNLHRLNRPAPRARRPREAPETRRVFETPGGSVKESRMKTTDGERRVLYTSRREGSIDRDQRFHSGLVDRVIAQRYRDGPTWSEAAEPEKPRRGWLRRGKEEPSAPVADEMPAEIAERVAPPVRETAIAEPPVRAAPPAVTRSEPGGDYQPQCAAVTAGGLQCRNSSKTGSDFCGSHQGYKPKRLEDILDTEPVRGEDTKAGVGDRVGTGQCAAYTKDGLQCRNNSRSSSKYCAVHRGYRPPSKSTLAQRLDTAPRFAGARDTKPKVR